ncbi:MAG: LUD domain-containing protein [Armatimonadota bacterium]|nr:LUD domain-containing protein [Armatimonadota bacterium]
MLLRNTAMPESTFHRKLVRDALVDVDLQTALTRAARAYKSARVECMQGFDFQHARAQLRAVKERCISNLPSLFERFKQEAEKVGAKVHEAKDGSEAAHIVAQIAHEHNARLIVKSKSMLTEEIRLNERLAAQGLSAVETDLGEWIVQLAGERPSHFTMPAMHKTREQVAELFSQVLGEPIPADIPTLVQVARKALRRCFVEADIGISGANIAVAESGTLVIVSNEGNARLVTTLPPVHIALIGYEKLVETLEDAISILKLLARCATGQKQTAYVSFVTGPSRTTDIEKTLTLGVHGPTEVHIVFVDNGRTAMAADSELREALYCIKCGACLNLCPVYNSVGGHAFSNTYMGGIGTVLTAYHAGLQAVEDTLDLCSGCATCTDVCPVGVDVPGMILELRRRVGEDKGLGLATRAGVSLIKHPHLLYETARLARALQRPVLRSDGTLRNLSLFSKMFLDRRWPGLARTFLRETLPVVQNETGSPRVGFFAGCLIDFVYPEIGLAISNVVTRTGAALLYPAEQSCCGAPALYLGDFATARKLAVDTIENFQQFSVDYVVTACPTCAVMLKYQFPRLLKDTEWYERAVELSCKIADFCQLASEVVPNGIFSKGAQSNEKVAYHSPCHQKRTLKTSDFSINLISAAGFSLVDMPDAEECCGFAGTYAVKQPDVSAAILSRKLDSILASEADVVVADCPGCIMQIRSGLAARGSSVNVVHSAQLLSERIG